jgi:hypothetical protein
VETQEQLEHLIANGSTEVKGDSFNPPLPGHQVP